MPVNYYLIAIAVWLLILSVSLVFILRYFWRLTKDVGKGNIIKVLDSVLTKEKKNRKEIANINKKIESIEETAQLHVQKVALVRFNPFTELGGDHSFSLALLDGKDTGIIITGLHTRERTRVYMKKIKKGKSEVNLSNEEKKTLKSALKK
jgi:hypothetical protein